jgi:hypothetical protein
MQRPIESACPTSPIDATFRRAVVFDPRENGGTTAGLSGLLSRQSAGQHLDQRAEFEPPLLERSPICPIGQADDVVE